MSKISKSPDRHTFQKEGYVKRMEENGETPSEDYLDYFEKIIEQDKRKFDDPETHKNNLEYDLLTTDWILEKVRARDDYAQNLYAAMCNNGFIKLEVIPVLKGEEWSCSWRYAGGIVADMRQEGDYIDWYCSGIRDITVESTLSEEEEKTWTDEQKARFETVKRYVREGCITDEIRTDLQRLGWAVAPGGDWEHF
jgi:hypothetical protein